MSRADKFALSLSILTVIAAAWIARNIFEGVAHLEDEFAYIWQAQVIARGELTVPSPIEAKSFLVPFVIDHDGQRFGKYPLGWPVVLSFGERLGLRWLVNPLLAGVGVWLTYRLGKKVFGEAVGLLAAGLTATSPFFLMNSGALLSHPWGLVLSTGFAIAWLDVTKIRPALPRWLPTLTAGLTLGVLGLSRPFTAVGIAIPFGIHGLMLLFRGSANIRQRVLRVGIIALLIGSLHLVWQWVVTGDPFLNPYTLWWEYDRVGFGPGVGVTTHGHNLSIAWNNLQISLRAGVRDLFGWLQYSWLFLSLGLIAIRKSPRSWLLMSVFPVLILTYLAYWIGSWVFGPRYYYESLFSLTILSAVGIAWGAGWPITPGEKYRDQGGWHPWRRRGVVLVFVLLMVGNLFFYIPNRIGSMRGLYGINRTQLTPFQTTKVQELTPALIIVHTDEWRAYATLLELAHPMLDSPYIFIWSRGPRSNAKIEAAFPDRQAFHYYPENPGELVQAER